MMPADKLISCQRLVPTWYQPGTDTVLDLSIGKGEFVSIIGPDHELNSEWLKTLCGLSDEYSGSVSVLGIDMSHLTQAEWTMARMNVAYIHADTELMSASSGLMNVLAPAFYHRLDENGHRQLLIERALDLLEDIDPDLNLDDLPAYVSKQQRFKLALARALLLDPRVVGLDQPFIYFTRAERKRLQKYLAARVTLGLSLIVATDDMQFVMRYSSRIIYIDSEQLVTFDSVDALRHSTNTGVSRYLKQHPET